MDTDGATSMVSAAELRHIVQAAGLAPSVHNTQPWTFLVRPTGLTLRAEVNRRLKVLDPDGRQLHLSCGAALFHARAAARAMGLDVAVQLLPDPADPEHLADLRLSEGAPADADEIRLAAAMLHRHTSRGAFDSRPVPRLLRDRMLLDAEREGALLREVVSEDDLIEVAVLVSRADSAEEGNPAYRDELAQWVHQDNATGDGMRPSDLQAAAGSELRQRDFTLAAPAATDGSAPAAEHPLVIVLATVADDPTAWLRAGLALAAVLLRAADQGVQAQPLGQVTDQLAYRLRLRGALGMLEMPQLVLRMGYGPPAPATVRRDLDEVLVTVAG